MSARRRREISLLAEIDNGSQRTLGRTKYSNHPKTTANRASAEKANIGERKTSNTIGRRLAKKQKRLLTSCH